RPAMRPHAANQARTGNIFSGSWRSQVVSVAKSKPNSPVATAPVTAQPKAVSAARPREFRTTWRTTSLPLGLVEGQVEFQNIDARLAQQTQRPTLSVIGDELADLFDAQFGAILLDAVDLVLSRRRADLRGQAARQRH